MRTEKDVVSFIKYIFIENEAAQLCGTMRKRFTLTLATI